MLSKSLCLFNTTKKIINLTPLLIMMTLCPTYSAFAVYESAQQEIPNFNIEDSQSNLALARIEQSKGNLTEAVFALERAVAIAPNNFEAHFLLGEIYAQLGEKDSAEKQFSLVINADKEQSSSAQVALDNLKYVREWSHQAVVGYRLGHDDNVNSGVNNTSIFIPSIDAPLVLPDSSAESDATTQTLYTSGNFRYQYTDHLAYVFKGTLAKTNDDFYNQSYVAIDVGARLNYTNYQRSFRFIQNFLDYDNFDEITSSRLNYEYLQKLKNTNYFKVAIDLQTLTYKTQDIRDDRRLTFRGQYRHLLSPTLSIKPSLFFARDLKSKESFEDLDYDSYGSKVTLDKQHSNKLASSFGLIYIVNNYDGEDSLFLRNRLDKRLQFRSELSWSIAQATKLSVAYQYTDNDSNIALYDFDKNVFFIDIAKTF